MSHPINSAMRDRIEVGILEADVEMGFTLVDMAEAEWSGGDPSVASRVIENAEDVYRDIEQRLPRLGVLERVCFMALVGELRREIDVARGHGNGEWPSGE